MPRAVRAALVDLDGTLLDTARDLAEAASRMLRELGRPATEVETIKGYIGNGIARLVKRALERLAGEGCVLASGRNGAFAVYPNGDRRRRPLAQLTAAEARELEASGALDRVGDAWVLSAAGKARALRESAAPAEQYAAQVGKSCRLFLQPEWDKAAEITPLIVEYIKLNPQWELSLQIHKYIHVP